MATSHLKSAAITNLDATPVVPITTGEGGPGYVRSVNGFVTALAADAAGSTYQLVRVPSNAKVKHLIFESEAQGAGAVQLGVYYSDAVGDGTPPALAGTALSVALFGVDVSLAALVPPADYVNGVSTGTTGTYTLDKRNQPLWQAAGLATDPGGFFDIVATVHTTAVTTGTGKLGADVQYVV